MEDDFNGRQPQWKTTLMEDHLNGRQPMFNQQLRNIIKAAQIFTQMYSHANVTKKCDWSHDPHWHEHVDRKV